MGYIGKGSYRDVQVLGPTQVLDVERVAFQTTGSGVYAEYPIDLASWNADRGADQLNALSAAIDELIATTAAIGATYLQDTDVSGLLIDYLDVIVEYDSGDPTAQPFTGTVRIPLSMFGSASDPWLATLLGSPQQMVDDEYQRLVAVASG